MGSISTASPFFRCSNGTWSVCGRYVVGMWSVHGRYVVGMWSVWLSSGPTHLIFIPGLTSTCLSQTDTTLMVTFGGAPSFFKKLFTRASMKSLSFVVGNPVQQKQNHWLRPRTPVGEVRPLATLHGKTATAVAHVLALVWTTARNPSCCQSHSAVLL